MNAKLTICAALAAVALTAGALAPKAEAKEKLTVWEGTRICTEWCVTQNKTLKNQIQCSQKCDAYWSKNGSDAVQK